ncbi:MAG: hypothetical protein ACO1NS_02095 [Daejeonella sp.]
MLVVKYLNPEIRRSAKAKSKAERIDALADKWIELQERKYFEKRKKEKHKRGV